MGLAITTDGRIKDMVTHGRADGSISKTYEKLNRSHDDMRRKFYEARTKMDDARNKADEARDQARSISFLQHPIRRIRAQRKYRLAREQETTMYYKMQAARSEYRTATLDLRDMRRTIREEHRISNSVDRYNNSLKKNIEVAKQLGIIIPHNILQEVDRDPGQFILNGDKRKFLNPGDKSANKLLKEMIAQKRKELKEQSKKEQLPDKEKEDKEDR